MTLKQEIAEILVSHNKYITAAIKDMNLSIYDDVSAKTLDLVVEAVKKRLPERKEALKQAMGGSDE